MRVYRRSKWDVTHSLTPKPEISPSRLYEYNIPSIPQKKKFNPTASRNNSFNTTQRSRKHRLMEQRNTQIQKSNRMLYQKIRKIMQKGHNSEKKVQPSPEQQQAQDPHAQFLNTSLKPLSLPQVSSNFTSLRSTRSQLNNILDDRKKFAEKYFADLETSREKMKNIHTQEIGDFVCYGWKVKVLLLDHGEYVLLRAKKGKKQLTKKYIRQRVRDKMEKGLEEWVSAKFQFEI